MRSSLIRVLSSTEFACNILSEGEREWKEMRNLNVKRCVGIVTEISK